MMKHHTQKKKKRLNVLKPSNIFYLGLAAYIYKYILRKAMLFVRFR